MDPVNWTSFLVARMPDHTIISTVNCLMRRVLREHAPRYIAHSLNRLRLV